MAVIARRWMAGAVAVALVLGACSDDDDGSDAGPDETVAPADDATTTTAPDPCGPGAHDDGGSNGPAAGGLDIPEVPDACPIPVTSLGLGLAIPVGWEATVLTDDALDQLADARLVRPAFLASARVWADDGASFYAAGVSESGAVSDLKVYVTDDAGTSDDALAARAQALVDSGRVEDPSIAGDAATGRVRVDFSITLPAADDSDETIDGAGSELLVADGDRLWRLIVTAESAEVRDTLLDVFGTSLTFA